MRGKEGRPFVPRGCPAWSDLTPPEDRDGMYVDAAGVEQSYRVYLPEDSSSPWSFATFRETPIDFGVGEGHPDDDRLEIKEIDTRMPPKIVTRLITTDLVYDDEPDAPLARTMVALGKPENQALRDALFEHMQERIADCPGVFFDTDGTPHCGALSGERYLETLDHMIPLAFPEAGEQPGM
ncbi:MAG TPA: hypothetical protein VJP80_02740 [Candidatus Saccharimonadales bacterium]|nr:hypothetical protein [Candidatus Saccharimonadales bacterium]